MNVKMCKKCAMLETRPRLTFNEEGICGACIWAEEKKTVIDWKKREEELQELCNKYRKNGAGFDCIVPVSGGKDGSMVAHKLKTKYGMNPLCININHSPEVNTEMNDINLHNFINAGFDCLRVYPNPKIERQLDKIGLVEYGQPYFGWMSAMLLAPIKLAIMFGAPLIMYAEEGEVEYGGSTELKYTPLYTLEHVKRLYLSGVDWKELCHGLEEKDLFWWLPPSEEVVEQINPAVAHWSYFESWNSNNNYLYAKENVGLQETEMKQSGTYNKFAQTDSILYPLHAYFMYLKFGFGRCTQDVCIDIRTGDITKEEGLEKIKRYDEEYPAIYEDKYLEYYQMTREEFHEVIDKWANKDLLEKKNGVWVKKYNTIEG